MPANDVRDREPDLDPYRLKGLVLVVGAVLVLSPDVLIIRLIETDRWTLLWGRGLLMAIGLAAYLGLRYRGEAVARARAIGRAGVFAAALFTGSTMMFVSSATLTTAANTLVILSAAPLFAAVFSRVFLKELVPARTWIAVAVAVAAIALIFAGSIGGGTLVGDLCAVASAACLAGYLVVLSHARAVSMIPALALSGLMVAAIMAPVADPLGVTPRDMALLALLGLLIMPIAFGQLTEGSRYLPPAEVSLITLLEMVLAPFWVWLAIGEVPGLATVIGGAVLLATLIAHAILGLRTTPPTAARQGVEPDVR